MYISEKSKLEAEDLDKYLKSTTIAQLRQAFLFFAFLVETLEKKKQTLASDSDLELNDT